MASTAFPPIAPYAHRVIAPQPTPVPCRKCGSAPDLLHNPRGWRYTCPNRNRVRGRSSFDPKYGCAGSNNHNHCVTRVAATKAWNRAQTQTRAHTTRDDWQFADPTPCPRCGLRGSHVCLVGDASARIPNPMPASSRLR